jgi:large subunit ribosomal protein L2
MGRRLKLQKRGKGSPKYKATIHAKVDVKYKPTKDYVVGQVIDFISDPIRNAPLAVILLSSGSKEYVIAPEGLCTGQKIEFGYGAKSDLGNVLALRDISPGTNIYNVEKNFGDGGKFARSCGQSAILVNKKEKHAIVKLSSGKIKEIPLDARASIGVVAGSGIHTKPFVKAGNKFFAMKAKGKPYPRVRGVAMNPVDHPFGGSQHHVGHSKSTSRHKPAGRKVGSIAARRSGRKKK